jgi:uncharacterized membrane protein (UPF0127 family)
MNRFSIRHTLLLAILTALPLTASIAQQTQPFAAISLTAGMHIIKAEVAATDAQRQQGLMYRENMAVNEGMVFVFERPAGVCMWMKNTPLPLSVAFLDDTGKIINIEDMKPHTTESHCAKKLASYALEMNQGWFKNKNIKPGVSIEGLPRLR